MNKKLLKPLARLRAWSLQVRSLRLRYPRYEFGRGTYGHGLKVWNWGEGATLRIGNYCSLAWGVQIYLGGGHRTDWVTTYPFSVLRPELAHVPGHPATKGDVVIGSDVWIGTEAVILSGVTVGHGAVIGARAFVARDVPPYAIVSGNPATIVRYRFDEVTVQRLLAVRWWDWPEQRILALGHKLLSPDINGFLDAAEAGEPASTPARCAIRSVE